MRKYSCYLKPKVKSFGLILLESTEVQYAELNEQLTKDRELNMLHDPVW